MRRSTKVAAPLLAATALAMMSGCRKPEMQRCVDENNKVVDDSFCANLPQNNGNQQYPNMGGGGFVPYVPLYHRYYGGWGGYALGTLVGGGSTSPVEGHSYITSRGVRTGTVRGGFGRSMSSGSHGGGAGE
ncbi:MAG: hypothetical protein JSS95_10575 [Acidobacteria bacterium]|nr:hypothetical protein [Acidobacteriota bacterium]